MMSKVKTSYGVTKYDSQFKKELDKLVKAGKVEEYTSDLLKQLYMNAKLASFRAGKMNDYF